MDTKQITAVEAAEIAGVTVRTIKRWARAREIGIIRDHMTGRARYWEHQVRARADARSAHKNDAKRTAGTS